MCDSNGKDGGAESSGGYSLPVDEQQKLPIEDATKPDMGDLVQAFPQSGADLGDLTPEEQAELDRPPGDRDPHCLIVGINRSLGSRMAVRGIQRADAGTRASTGDDEKVRRVGEGEVRETEDGRVVWTARITSRKAESLRLLVREVDLPEGSRIYVTDGVEQVWGPYAPRRDPFWTHSVFGDTAFIQVQIPAAEVNARQELGFTVAAVAHFRVMPAHDRNRSTEAGDAGEGDSALTDDWPGGAGAIMGGIAARLQKYCRPATLSTPREVVFEKISRAIALIRWPVGSGRWGQCTGGLLRDRSNSRTPFLLTAHHCFGSQGAARDLEAYWNFVGRCGGSIPPMQSVPRTLGATLIATGSATDFTLVQLRQRPPATAHFLRWTSTDISTTPTSLYRLSHPGGDSQNLTVAVLSTVGGRCGRVYLHSRPREGGTAPGSSGSPVLRAVGDEPEVVGQLYGWCNASAMNIDGSFAQSYPRLAPYIGEDVPPTGDEGPQIEFVALPESGESGTRVKVSVRVTDPQGVAAVRMRWEATNAILSCPGSNNEDWWCEQQGDVYTWTILLGASPNPRRFFVEAEDVDGNRRQTEPKTIRVRKAAAGRILVVEQSQTGAERNIIRFNADGSGKKVLTASHPGDNHYAPAWSPDGEYILYISDRDGPAKLYRMDAEGEGVTPFAGEVKTISAGDAPAWGPVPTTQQSRHSGF